MASHSTSVLVPWSSFDFRPAIPQKGAQHPLLFGPCVLWLNGGPSQLLLSAKQYLD